MISSVLLTTKMKYLLRSTSKMEDLILFTKTCKQLHGIKQTQYAAQKILTINILVISSMIPKLRQKKYWSITKTFANGKKVPVIPSILVNNKLLTNFNDKASIFNDFFSKQY